MNNGAMSLKQVIVLQQKYATGSKLLYAKAWLMLGCLSLERNLWMFVVARGSKSCQYSPACCGE